MIDLIIVLTTGLLTGIAIGLFPVFPVYLGAFILYFTGTFWTPEQMVIFWIATAIGSQFFGSVSAITLGIPGDASSLIYIDKIKKFNLTEKNQLLWLTSKGSLIGGFISLLMVWILYHFYLSGGSTFLSKIEIRFALFVAIFFLIFYLSSNKIWAAVLALIGILISPQNNYSLPLSWYWISLLFQETTFFMLILGLMIIPDLATKSFIIENKNEKFIPTPGKISYKYVMKNSFIGCMVGLIPGPAAETAAAAAYGLAKKKHERDRILAAETANNPGVIMMLLPFFSLGLPLTASSLVMTNIMDLNQVDVIELAQKQSSMITGISIFDSVILSAILVTVIYYVLSSRFIDIYVGIIKKGHTNLKLLLISLVGVMIAFDAIIQQISITTYASLIVLFCMVGLILKKYRVSPMPLIFTYLLGDQLVWTVTQFFLIHA